MYGVHFWDTTHRMATMNQQPINGDPEWYCVSCCTLHHEAQLGPQVCGILCESCRNPLSDRQQYNLIMQWWNARAKLRLSGHGQYIDESWPEGFPLLPP